MELNGQLKQIVDDYLRSHPSLTLNALATRSNTSATTLRRIVSQGSKSEVSPHVVLSIVSYIYKEKRISTLLKVTTGSIKETLEKHFSSFIFENTEHTYDEELNRQLSDKTSYLIYKLAANRSGVLVDEISVYFGKSGIQKAEELKEKGMIHQIGDHFHARDKNFTLDLSIAKKHIGALVDFYKINRVSEGKNLFYSMSESVNEQTITEIKNIKKEAIKKIQNLLSDPKSNGQVPYFSIFLSDTMSFDSKELLQKDCLQ